MNSVEIYLTNNAGLARDIAHSIPLVWGDLSATVTEVRLRSPKYAVVVHYKDGAVPEQPFLNYWARGFAAARILN